MMTALEYLKLKSRMTCKNSAVCFADCPLSIKNNNFNTTCCTLECKYPEKAIKIVESWGKGHPFKTFLMDFKEKYPNAPLDDDEVPCVCPHDLGYTDKADKENCDWDCKKCWNREFKADEKVGEEHGA